eukprot:1157554-Pelagomonas_calceolata.AAC.1
MFYDNIASRIILKCISKGPLGAGLASMNIGSADRLALQDLQIPEHPTNRTLPKYTFTRRFPDKQRLTSSRPDAILVVPVKECRGNHFWYLLRSRGGHWGTGSIQCQPQPLHLLPRHLAQESAGGLQATAPRPMQPSFKILGSSHPPYILLGVGGVIYTPHTMEPLKELGLDTHTATKLVLKLHAHSVQYAYYLCSTRCTLEKTLLDSHHQDQARATASNPPDPH